MKCSGDGSCTREVDLKCGECQKDFCDDHLLFFEHPERESKFFCRLCCTLFELERPSW